MSGINPMGDWQPNTRKHFVNLNNSSSQLSKRLFNKDLPKANTYYNKIMQQSPLKDQDKDWNPQRTKIDYT